MIGGWECPQCHKNRAAMVQLPVRKTTCAPMYIEAQAKWPNSFAAGFINGNSQHTQGTMMPDLTTFATEEYPLHPSSMQALLTCPWRVVHLHLHPSGDDESGPAADTGSAMHKAAATFHKGKGEADAIAAMHAGTQEYPQADLADAAGLFLKYASDPRNRGIVTPLVEDSIAFTISPAAHDKTKTPIKVIGRVDQVRQHDDGRLRAWDIKTSKKDPMEVLYETTYQMAGYCVGASIKLGKRVDPGGIIMPRQYKSAVATSPVFWPFAWSYDDLEGIMEAVRNAVANVRNGHVHHLPSAGNCRWCHLRSPDNCYPRLRDFRKRQQPAQVADPGCCEEASAASVEVYIPCNQPAVAVLFSSKDNKYYRMCVACSDHNQTHGMRLVGPYS